MAQQTSTVLLQGGLNLVSAPISMPPGHATAAVNYEPDVSGYHRMDGYERYSGKPSPSDGADEADIAARRAAIGKVPGSGPVRGVWVYDGHVYAFRDTVGGEGRMYKDSPAGWVEQTFGHVLDFSAGTAEFFEGETLVGTTSAATAKIERVVLRSGIWDSGDASGYLILSGITGTFQAETVTSSSGSAAITSDVAGVSLHAGGTYEFTNHNFYGAKGRRRMYFANGVGTAFEWDGSVLAPIRTGNAAGSLDDVIAVLARGGGGILTRGGGRLIMRGEHDKPSHISAFSNHLFLSYDVGSVLHSGVGEPLDFRAAAGAAEIAFGDQVTAFVTSSTSLVFFGQNRIDYLTGNDSDNFLLSPITDAAGAAERTVQMADQPIYLDAAGLRNLGTTAAFGDWRLGTLTQLVEPLFKAKRKAKVKAAASLRVKSKDQYRLFFADKTGVTVYLGRKNPETLPFLLPCQVFCACAGEINEGDGERLFVGSTDGYVYELDRGTSFDGAEVQAYIRLAWNSASSPSQNKRFHGASIELDCEDDTEIGVAFHVDYAIPGNPGGSRNDVDVAAGSASFISQADYDGTDFSMPVQGVLKSDLDGIGRNVALTLVSEHTHKKPHTLSSMTVNFSWRGLVR